jgi:hypothetical protein
MRKIEAHPDAAIFPMMSADEIADLAVDIKANGLRFPIVIGKFEDREVIVDGRNRFEACQIAEVEPTFEPLNGRDPKAFILSVNIKRRHMNAGQRAMATAMIYPKGTQGKKTSTSSATKEDQSVSAAGLSRARSVLAFSPVLAASVLAGIKTLDAAYNESRMGEGNIKNDAARIRALHAERPDLAARVNDAELTLDAAIALAKSEAEEAKQLRWAATLNIIEGLGFLDRDPESAPGVAAMFDPSLAEQRGQVVTPERMRRVAAFVLGFATALEGQS